MNLLLKILVQSVKQLLPQPVRRSASGISKACSPHGTTRSLLHTSAGGGSIQIRNWKGKTN